MSCFLTFPNLFFLFNFIKFVGVGGIDRNHKRQTTKDLPNTNLMQEQIFNKVAELSEALNLDKNIWINQNNG